MVLLVRLSGDQTFPLMILSIRHELVKLVFASVGYQRLFALCTRLCRQHLDEVLPIVINAFWCQRLRDAVHYVRVLSLRPCLYIATAGEGTGKNESGLDIILV